MDQRSMETKFTHRRAFANHLCDLLDVGVEHPQPLAAEALAAIFDDPLLTPSKCKDDAADMERFGIISRRVVYGDHKNGLPIGRNVFWSLMKNRDEVMGLLDKIDKEEMDAAHRNLSVAMKKRRAQDKAKATAPSVAYRVVDSQTRTANPAEVTVRFADDQPVEAIAGPEPDRNFAFEALRSIRKDESYALVEAARQYGKRSGAIEKQFSDLVANAKSLGISLDENMLRASVRLDTDERLESVVLVLPYITQLENAVNRMAGQMVEMRDKVKAYDALTIENKRQKAQIERLIVEKAARNG